MTLLTADTMNDVNRLHYTILGDPATLAALKATVVTAAVGGSMALIESKTASASANIDFTSISNTVYASYMIVGDEIVGADGQNLLLRFSESGVFNATASDYTHEQFRFTASASGISGQAAAGGGTGIPINSTGAPLGANTGEKLFFIAHISNMATTASFKRVSIQAEYLDATPVYLHMVGGGSFVKTPAAADGFRFILDSGSIASGTFKLYGIKGA